MKRHIPTWPVAALMILTPVAVLLFSQGVSRGITPSGPNWCQMNEEQNVWEVHQIENYEVVSTEEGGCIGKTHSWDTRSDDKGVVGTCPWRQTCGEIWKLKSVNTSDAQLAAALRYAKSEVEENTYLIGPQDAAKSDWGSFEDIVRSDPQQGVEATFEHWIGCRSRRGGTLSDKKTICLDGHVFRIRYDDDIPEKYDMACTCNGDSSEWEGFGLCIDFDCPEDTAPKDGAGICPNIDNEPVIDGDDESADPGIQ